MENEKQTLREAATAAAENGYLLALCDADGRYISSDVKNDIDELDEFNEVTVTSDGTLVASNGLDGLTTLEYNVEPEEGQAYTNKEFNNFLRSL